MSRHNNQDNTNSNVNYGDKKNKLESGTNIGKQKSVTVFIVIGIRIYDGVKDIMILYVCIYLDL